MQSVFLHDCIFYSGKLWHFLIPTVGYNAGNLGIRNVDLDVNRIFAVRDALR